MGRNFVERSVVEQIVERICDLEGSEPRELPPLYDAIDPDALEALLGSAADRPDASVEVTFSYSTYTVTATDDGEVRVRDATDSATS